MAINLPEEVYSCLERQNFVIVTTIGKDGLPHSACKGIVDIKKEGKIFILDLYKKVTYTNLKNNPKVSLVAVEESSFRGYCLKGYAELKEICPQHQNLLNQWNERIVKRISQRVVSHIKKHSSSFHHPELKLPHPQYIILVDVKEIIDLAPKFY